jgi:hypothetical protein
MASENSRKALAVIVASTVFTSDTFCSVREEISECNGVSGVVRRSLCV